MGRVRALTCKMLTNLRAQWPHLRPAGSHALLSTFNTFGSVLLGSSRVGRRWWRGGWLNLEPSPSPVRPPRLCPVDIPISEINTYEGFQVRPRPGPPPTETTSKQASFAPPCPPTGQRTLLFLAPG